MSEVLEGHTVDPPSPKYTPRSEQWGDDYSRNGVSGGRGATLPVQGGGHIPGTEVSISREAAIFRSRGLHHEEAILSA